MLLENTIHLGDCLELMQQLPEASVDMILCDLPYGTTQNKWDSVIPLQPLWEAYNRVAKPGAIVALTGSQPFTSKLVLSNLVAFKHEWIWVKNRGSNFANTVREPMKEHESVLIFARSKWTYNKQMEERKGTGAARVKYVIDPSTESSNFGDLSNKKATVYGAMRVPSSLQKFNTETGIHPTQKPVALFEYLIKTYTNPGDLVLDNCAGSGTTAVACKQTGRRYLCIEKDRGYWQKACERVNQSNGFSGVAI